MLKLGEATYNIPKGHNYDHEFGIAFPILNRGHMPLRDADSLLSKLMEDIQLSPLSSFLPKQSKDYKIDLDHAAHTLYYQITMKNKEHEIRLSVQSSNGNYSGFLEDREDNFVMLESACKVPKMPLIHGVSEYLLKNFNKIISEILAKDVKIGSRTYGFSFEYGSCLPISNPTKERQERAVKLVPRYIAKLNASINDNFDEFSANRSMHNIIEEFKTDTADIRNKICHIDRDIFKTLDKKLTTEMERMNSRNEEIILDIIEKHKNDEGMKEALELVTIPVESKK